MFNRKSKWLAVSLACLVSFSSIQFSKPLAARRVFTNFKNLKVRLGSVSVNNNGKIIGTLADDLSKVFVKPMLIGQNYFKPKVGNNNLQLKYISLKSGDRAKEVSKGVFTSYTSQGYYPFESRDSVENPRGTYTRANGFYVYTYGDSSGKSIYNVTSDSRWYSGAKEYLGTNIFGGTIPNDDFPWYSSSPQLPFSARKLEYRPTPQGAASWRSSLVKTVQQAEDILIKTPSGSTITFHDYMVKFPRYFWYEKTGALMRPKTFSDYKSLYSVRLWEKDKIPGGSESKLYDYIFISQLPTYYSNGIVYMERDGGQRYISALLPALSLLDTVDLDIKTISHKVLGVDQRKSKDDVAIYKPIDTILKEQNRTSDSYVDHELVFRITAKDLGYYEGEEYPPFMLTVPDNCEILRTEWASDIPVSENISYNYTSANGVDSTGTIINSKTNIIKSLDFSSSNTQTIKLIVRETLDKSNSSMIKSVFSYTAMVGAFADKATTALSNNVLFVYNEIVKTNNVVTLNEPAIVKPINVTSDLIIEEDEYKVEYRYPKTLDKNDISLTLPSGYSWNDSTTIVGNIIASISGIIKSVTVENDNFSISSGSTSIQPTSIVTISRDKVNGDDPVTKKFADAGTYTNEGTVSYQVSYSPSYRSARKLTCKIAEGTHTKTVTKEVVDGEEVFEPYPGYKIKKKKFKTVTETITWTHTHDDSCYDYKSVSPKFTWTNLVHVYKVKRDVFNGTNDIPKIEPVQKSSGSNPSNIWFYEKITLQAGTDIMREMFNRIKNARHAVISSTRILVPARFNRDIYVQSRMSIQNNTQPTKRLSLGKNKATDKFAKQLNMDVYKAGYTIVPQGQVTLNIDLTRFARLGDTAVLDSILKSLDDKAYIEGDFDLGVISGRKTERVSFNEIAAEQMGTIMKAKISNVNVSVAQSSLTGTTPIDSNGTTINRYLQRKENGNTGGYNYDEVYTGNLVQHRATGNLVIDINPNGKKFMLHPGLKDGEYHLYVKTAPFTITAPDGRNINVPEMTLYTYRFTVKGSAYDDLDIDSDYVIEDTY